MSSSVIGKRVYLTVYVSYEPLHSLPTAPSNFLNSRASASGYGHTVYFYQIVEREQRGMMHLPFRLGSALLLIYIVCLFIYLEYHIYLFRIFYLFYLVFI